MHWPECALLANCDVERAWFSAPLLAARPRPVHAAAERPLFGPITHGEAVTRRKADIPLIVLPGGNE